MNIQWFPGHMAKTRRLIAENLKLVDVVIELLDARIPISSKNPEIDALLQNKPRIAVFNKMDLADDRVSQLWTDFYKAKKQSCVFIDSKSGKGTERLKGMLKDTCKEKFEREKLKGKIFTSVRTMVVGIPNVGKSSLINRLAGKASAVTGDKPGVTKGKQWIRINQEIELLDTPGILWPKFEDQTVGFHLAFTGAIKDDVIDSIETAAALFEMLSVHYPQKLSERYKLLTLTDQTGIELLSEAGKKRGCMISGGEIDLMRISSIVLDEFRGGKIGRISLERPSIEV